MLTRNGIVEVEWVFRREMNVHELTAIDNDVVLAMIGEWPQGFQIVCRGLRGLEQTSCFQRGGTLSQAKQDAEFTCRDIGWRFVC